jgi:hypothetical protein
MHTPLCPSPTSSSSLLKKKKKKNNPISSPVKRVHSILQLHLAASWLVLKEKRKEGRQGKSAACGKERFTQHTTTIGVLLAPPPASSSPDTS